MVYYRCGYNLCREADFIIGKNIVFPSILPRQVRLEGIEPTRCQSREIYSLPRLLNGLQTHIICNLYLLVVAKQGSINEVVSSNDNTCPMRTSTGKGSRTLRTQILSLVPMPIRLYPHSSPGRARTADPLINSQMLLPTELQENISTKPTDSYFHQLSKHLTAFFI